MKDQDNNLTFFGKVLERLCTLKLPLIGHMSFYRQIRILYLFLLVSLLFGGFFICLSDNQKDLETIQAQVAGDALMHAQRMAKAAPNAIQGNFDAFKQLRDSRYELIIDLNLLIKGGDYKGYSLDSAKSADLQLLSDGEKIWSSTDKAAATILKLQKELIAFAEEEKKLPATTPPQSYIDAQKAGQLLAYDNEDLRLHLIAVQSNYRNQSELTSLSDYFMFFGLAMAFLAASSIALVLMQESQNYAKEESARRAQADMQMMQAQKQESEAKQVNDQNQAAILRLMNELQEIADGDLTIRATVSNDFTGAIADTVNFAVEELCSLVGRVATIADQVATSANQAEEVSTSLITIYQHQSLEINTASKEILTMAADIAGVAGHIQRMLSATEQMQDGVQQTAQLIRVSSVLAQELQNAVSRFRVTV